MLVFAAIGVFGAGMLAIAAGIPIKDFGYGNTLILSGVMAWCTSAIMLTLWACVRELKKAQPHAEKSNSETAVADARPAPPPVPSLPPGWPEAIPERVPAAAPPPPPAASAPPAVAPREPRRNLLFTSTRRPKDAGPLDITAPADAGAPPTASAEARLVTPEESRPPVPRRLEQSPPRTLRPSATIAPRAAAPPPPAPPSAAPPPPPAPPPPVLAEEAPTAPPREPERPGRGDNSNVSVLKSGVVDGMAYWLYSDGSIEAQMPEGMMRFTSIDELRAHLDKRP